MRTGTVISGVMHGGLLAVALFGAQWFSPRAELPLTVSEIELVDGTEFDAALSQAPVVPNQGPAELKAPSDAQDVAADVETPLDEAKAAEAPQLAQTPPPEPRPDVPDLVLPKPPTPIPTEEPRPTIAEIPSPDPLDRQALAPESPAATEPVSPLKTITPPVPADRPTPPPQPEPEPEPVETAEVKDKDETAEEQPKPDPEPAKDPEPVETAQQQVEAPEGPAPREAKLPVAKPADLAAAAAAAAEAERKALAEAKAKDQEKRQAQADSQKQQQGTNTPSQKKTETPQRQSSGGNVASGPLSRGEKNALRLGIKKFYNYSGDRSDRRLAVVIRVNMNPDGTISGKPTLRQAQGGTKAAQNALFQAGRRALIRAQNAGEFKKLPRNKYPRWRRLNFVFTIDRVGFQA